MPSERLKELSSALDQMVHQGHTTVDIHALKKFIEEPIVDEPTDEDRRDAARRAHEISLETWKARASIQSNAAFEMFRSVVEAGGSALKAAMLLNGGASIALLTFLGNAWAKYSGFQAAELAGMNEAMVWFFSGTAAAGFAYMARYLTQFCYHQEWHKTAYIFHTLAFLAGAASLTAFVAGGLYASSSFRTP